MQDTRFVKRRGGYGKWIFALLCLFAVFTLCVLALLTRYYVMRQVIQVPTPVINETATDYAASSARSSADSRYIVYLNSAARSQQSSSSKESRRRSSSEESSFYSSIRSSEAVTSTSMEGTTTTLNYDYTSYRMKIPTFMKECNPLSIKLENGTIIPPVPCVAINATCCPCSINSYINGEWEKTSWGGRVDAISQEWAAEYKSKWLHNCSGFGVVCRMASSPTGCEYTAACINGRCSLVARS